MSHIYAQFWFFIKEFENSFSNTFCIVFFKKNVFHIIFYWRNKFYCMIVFNSVSHTEKCVYCNCLFPRLWRHKFWPKCQDKKKSWEEKYLSKWNKKHFTSFLKGFQLPKIVPDLKVNLLIIFWEIKSLRKHKAPIHYRNRDSHRRTA